jgi:hypothetical protein
MAQRVYLSFRSEEVSMPIVAIFQSPTLTQQTYEEIVRRLTAGKKTRMESRADWPVPGIIVHAAGQGAHGFRVVDVWESEEAFRKFGEKLRPIMQAVGVQGDPETYPAHALVS